MRICIIGYSGSGKSTLARKLGEFYQIPVLHLDNVQFYGDWQERSQEEQDEIVRHFIKSYDNWVIDGNYYKVALERFELCDEIYFLDYNRIYCYFQCFKRYLMNLGRSRSSCPCVEKFDLDFQRWILFDGRTKERKDNHFHYLIQFGKKKYHFKYRNQLKQHLQKLKGND